MSSEDSAQGRARGKRPACAAGAGWQGAFRQPQHPDLQPRNETEKRNTLDSAHTLSPTPTPSPLMPPSSRARVPLTFPARSGRSLPLSQTAVFPPGFEPPMTHTPSTGRSSGSFSSGSSTSSSSSKGGSPRSSGQQHESRSFSFRSSSSVSQLPATAQPPSKPASSSDGTVRAAGGILDMSLILQRCLSTKERVYEGNDRYSPPVVHVFVPPPAPVLFPSEPPVQLRKTTTTTTTGGKSGKGRSTGVKKTTKSAKGGSKAAAAGSSGGGGVPAAASAASTARSSKSAVVVTSHFRPNLHRPSSSSALNPPKSSAKRKSGLGSTSFSAWQPSPLSQPHQPGTSPSSSNEDNESLPATKKRRTSNSPLSQEVLTDDLPLVGGGKVVVRVVDDEGMTRAVEQSLTVQSVRA